MNIKNAFSSFLPNKKQTATTQEIKVPVNQSLLDVIAPMNFNDSDPTCVEVNGIFESTYVAHKFEPMVDINWAQTLFQTPGSTTALVMRPTDKEKLVRAINNSDARQGVKLYQGGSASDMDAAERTRDHGRTMLRVMGDANEAFFETCVYTQLAAPTQTDLLRERNTFEAKTSGGQVTMKFAAGRQRDTFFAASPLWVENDLLFRAYGRDICSSTLAASLPTQDNSVDDGSGHELGTCEPDGSICRLRLDAPTERTSNRNMFITGASGNGKTTSLFVITGQDIALGNKVIVFDYERTFKTGCTNAGGQWVGMGQGAYFDKNKNLRGVWLSPLQPRLGAQDPGAEDIDDTQEVLHSTINFLHGWAELAWGLNPKTDFDYLDNGLRLAYRQYGIDYTTQASDLIPDNYPVMSDLVSVFDDLAESAPTEEDKSVYRRLSRKAKSCTEEGQYGKYWARRSNVDITNDFVVFDLYELHDADANVKTACLYSALTWAWSQACVSRVTNQFLRIVIDEGHEFFNGGTTDSRSNAAAQYINSIQKRIRKYNGGILFATQNLGDCLHADVRRFGEALITSSAYKLFFGTDATDLEMLMDITKFTPYVENLIKEFLPGECLLCAGNTHAQVKIDYTPFMRKFWESRL